MNKFAALPYQDHLVHVDVFLDPWDTITMDDIPVDYIRLKAFKFSLDGMTLAWFKSLAPWSIFSWETILNAFMTKFFPPSKTNALRMKITGFNILPDETNSHVGRDSRSSLPNVQHMTSLDMCSYKSSFRELMTLFAPASIMLQIMSL